MWSFHHFSIPFLEHMWNLSIPMRGYTTLISPLALGELSPISSISKVEFICPARTLASVLLLTESRQGKPLLILHLPKELEEGLSIGSVHTEVEEMVLSI